MPIAVQVIGYLASIFIPLSFLPQTIKIIKTRETKGISIPAYTIYFTGIIAFLVFASFKTPIDIPMIICQTFNGIFAIIILTLASYNIVTESKKQEKNDKSTFTTKVLTFSKKFLIPLALLLVSVILLVIGALLKEKSLKIYTDIMGYTGAALISIAFLPQTYKLFKTKNTKGLSLITYSIYHLGLTLFIIYASFTQNWPLLAGNAFGWVVNFFLLILICYNLFYKKDPSKKEKTKKIKN